MFKFSLIIEMQAVIRLSLLIAERSAREKKKLPLPDFTENHPSTMHLKTLPTRSLQHLNTKVMIKL